MGQELFVVKKVVLAKFKFPDLIWRLSWCNPKHDSYFSIGSFTYSSTNCLLTLASAKAVKYLEFTFFHSSRVPGSKRETLTYQWL